MSYDDTSSRSYSRHPLRAFLTKQIPWLRVFVEGVVIVGSILDPVLEPYPVAVDRYPWTALAG